MRRTRKQEVTNKIRKSKDNSEENLRGKLRELQKQLEMEKRYSRSLEKQIKSEFKTKNDLPSKKELEKKEEVCPSCGKEGGATISKIWTPNGDMLFVNCKLCGQKSRIN